MFKEPYELEKELEALEKDMGSKFEGIEQAPVRENFQGELRSKLLEKIESTEASEIIESKTKPERQKSLGNERKGFGGLRNWKAIMSVGMIIIMLAAVFWGVNNLGYNPEIVHASGINIKALDSDSMGIDAETSFLLTSAEPLPEKAVKTALKVTPEFAYSLDKQAGGQEYKIIPSEKLSANTIYTLSFDPEGLGKENLSWAFQTKAEFQVIRSLPRNESSHVPVDTGIELIFSHENYDPNKIKDYFSISPKVAGTFEKHKKTMVFLPKALQPSTIYTVTLKKGMPLEGTTETLQEDYVFSFETTPANKNNLFNFEMDTDLTEFSTTDIPAFPVYFYNEKFSSEAQTIPSLEIDLYRYTDSQEFQASLEKRDKVPRWSYVAWNEYREKLNPKLKIAEYKTEFLKADNYNYYVVFPEELEKGYYAAELKAGDTIKQVWFQVTDLAVYQAQGEESSIFWVNDLITKKPAANVHITIDNSQVSAKGEDNTGAVLIKAKLMGDKREYALVESEDKEVLVPLEAWQYWYGQRNSGTTDYWKYLYLDRELYQPEDTVHFWGVLAPRGKNNAHSEEITLKLMGSSGPYYEGAEISPILTQKIAVSNKTFSGEMKLPVLKPGYYYIELQAGDTVLLSRGFEVDTYQKPSYQLTLDQDKRAIFAGESTGIQAKTSFFEGTAVPELKLTYHIEGKEGKVTTDAKGEAVIPYTGEISYDNYYSAYHNVSLGVYAQLPEAGEIYQPGQLYVFKSKVYLNGEAKRKGDSYSLTGKLSTVDLTAINNGEYPSEENFLTEPVANSIVKAALYQEIWTPEEVGERYDFISKKVVKNYSYNYSTKKVNNFELKTDADGQISYTGKIDSSSSYYLDLSASDNEGREFIKRIHIGGNSGYPDSQHYFLQTDRGTEGYKPGETVEVTCMVNDKELVLDSPEQSILFYRGQSFIDSYQVEHKGKYNFTFQAEHIPNTSVYGVYFDGSNYYEAYSLNIPFARETKGLNVKIIPDQQEYRPGSSVKIEIQVKDVDNKPVKGAQVNLNLVDEALFSLRNQNVSFLDSLYGDYQNFFVYTRKSHDNIIPPGGAESGGEGGSDRKDFRDTVLFSTVTTDSEGKAGAEFQLPDNLTSWRVTYHAFTENLQAGSGTTQIPVRLPFFLEMTLNQNYLEGDSPTVILRSFGEQLRNKQAVAYKMMLKDSKGGEKSWSAEGVSFTPLDWELPALTAGKYSLTVSATSEGMTDSLTREFTVAESFQERTVTSQGLLAEDFKIQGSEVKPTTIVFCDYEKSQYLRGLYQLAWNNGSRLEQKLARLEARKLLSDYFPEENLFGESGEQESLLTYQQTDGGISILPYGESELALSAMVAAGTAGVFDEDALTHYFYRVLDELEQEQERSLALLGLAALREPVLIQINNYLAEKNLEPAVRINLALALLELGDGAYADKLFTELFTQYGEELETITRIKAGDDQDEILEATTQMALLASRLDRMEKNKLYQYLLENTGNDILNSVEQIQMLKSNLKYMKADPVSFSYELNGEKARKTLKDKELFKLTLLPEDLKKIKITAVEGKVGVMSKFDQPIKAGEHGDGEALEISRSYLIKDLKATTMNRTDLVQVVINYNIGDKAPSGLYEIIDVLPAGLTHISRPYDYRYNRNTRWDYPVEVNGQKLVFQLSKGQNKITYLARVISPGEFNCEAPILSNINNNSIYTSGSTGKISIK